MLRLGSDWKFCWFRQRKRICIPHPDTTRPRYSGGVRATQIRVGTVAQERTLRYFLTKPNYICPPGIQGKINKVIRLFFQRQKILYNIFSCWISSTEVAGPGKLSIRCLKREKRLFSTWKREDPYNIATQHNIWKIILARNMIGFWSKQLISSLIRRAF